MSDEEKKPSCFGDGYSSQLPCDIDGKCPYKLGDSCEKETMKRVWLGDILAYTKVYHETPDDDERGLKSRSIYQILKCTEKYLSFRMKKEAE